MTLLVALRGSDGMVLAADSRGTFGDPRGITAQNDAQIKATIVSHHVATLAAGTGALGTMITETVQKHAQDNKEDWADNILNIFMATCRGKYNEWFPTIPAVQPVALVQAGHVATRPELAFLLAGYNHDGKPRLYSLMSQLDFAPMLHDYGFAVQGVAQYALYLLNRLYESDRTLEELTALAIYTITETASQDGKVGGPVTVVTIKPGKEGCQFLSSEAVEAIQKSNESRSKALRNSFYSNKAGVKAA